MRTSKTISNIGYMSAGFFAHRVKSLREKDLIPPCLWIAHKGEDGDKDHLHILLLGGFRTLDTSGLSTLFGFEVFRDGSTGSVTNMWTPTKDVRDWLLYGIHEPVYLLRKGLTRDHSYSWEDIKSSEGPNDDTLRRLIVNARQFLTEGEDKVYRACRIAVNAGWSWHDTIIKGIIPVNCLGSAYHVYEALWREKYGNGEGPIFRERPHE